MRSTFFMRLPGLFILLFILLVNFSCSTTSKIPADIHIKDVEFTTYPYILQRKDSIYLVYKVKADERKPNVRLLVGEQAANNKCYYFFVGKTSFPEYGFTVYRPINKTENIVRLINAGAVFWLNPDMSEVKLQIVSE